MSTLEKFGAILGFSGIIATSAGCKALENPNKTEVVILEEDSVGM